MIVAKNLRKLRAKTKYSQKDMADLLNLDRNTYINYENGNTDVKSQYLPKLAEIFNVEIADFFTEEKIAIINNIETHDNSVGQKDMQQNIVINLINKETAEKLSSILEKLILKL